MCTVTYVRNHAGSIILTSNRDEHVNRPPALPPRAYQHGAHTLYYPRDPQGNGTWFGINDRSEVVILLNGAAQKHVPQPPYRLSRGIIVLELLSEGAVLEHWHRMDVDQIEPFTIVYATPLQLVQLQWNGFQKSTVPLDPFQPHIWSSSTLYTEPVRAERKNWFHVFLRQKNNCPNDLDLLQFHTQTHSEDAENGIVINRNGTMLTKSVSQCVLSASKMVFTHLDLVANLTNTLCHSTN